MPVDLGAAVVVHGVGLRREAVQLRCQEAFEKIDKTVGAVIGRAEPRLELKGALGLGAAFAADLNGRAVLFAVDALAGELDLDGVFLAGLGDYLQFCCRRWWVRR